MANSIKFYSRTVYGTIANTDYEGEIKAFGDTVIIRTTPNIDIKDYFKGMKLVYDVYESEKVTLKIDKGKYWAFGVDDVDKRQSDLPYVDKWSDDASQQMKIKIDTGILADIYADVPAANKGATAGASSASYNLGASGAANIIAITKANVIDYIVDCEAVLTEQNLPETDRWIKKIVHFPLNNWKVERSTREKGVCQ